MFASKFVVPVVARFICPSLNTLSMLKVIFPLSFIHGSIDMSITTRTISLVVSPEAFINISIYMNKLALSVSSVIAPFSSVQGTISPFLLTFTITESSFPLSSVNSARFELIRRSAFSRLVSIPKPFANSFTSFFLSEIFRTSELV